MDNTNHNGLTRRGFCLCCVGTAAFAATGGLLAPKEAFAKGGIIELILSEAAKSPITTHKLRGGVSMLEGSGGNIAVFTGSNGKILIDAGIAVSRPRIEEALTALGTQPIQHLINTHWHLDHTSGNEWLHSEGAVILAHVDTLKHLSVEHRVPDWDYDFPATPAGGLPTELMNAERHVKMDDETLFLKHYDPAHTDCDISVYFQEADILHTGDTFWNGIYPFIDYSTGGSIDGMIKAADVNVKTTTNKTIVIPGHGPLGNRKDLVAYRDMLVAIRGNIAKLKKKGHSVDEVVAAKPTAKFDAKWGKFVIDPVFFTQLVYEGV